jgi:3-oxoacyl-[acyl-carrier protein] reductase
VEEAEEKDCLKWARDGAQPESVAAQTLCKGAPLAAIPCIILARKASAITKFYLKRCAKGHRPRNPVETRQKRRNPRENPGRQKPPCSFTLLAFQMPSRHVLIVGVSGVAAATALQLAKGGHATSLSLLYRSREEEAKSLAQLLSQHSIACSIFRADVTVDSEVRAAFASAIETHGPLTYAINCAGATVKVPFSDLDGATDDIWMNLYSANVVGAFHVTRAASKCMVSTGEGCIINISSVAAKLSQGSSLPYACSKAALDTMVIGLARELGPKGIRVIGVAPGFIAGGWLEGLLKDEYEPTKAAFEAALPLRRVCTPESVAEVVAALCTSASMITGQTITVDGGMSIKGFSAVL